MFVGTSDNLDMYFLEIFHKNLKYTLNVSNIILLIFTITVI